MNRRNFLRTAAGAAALLGFRRRASAAFATSTPLQKFVAKMPTLGKTGIPVAAPDTITYPGVDFYRIQAGVYRQRLHPALPPTRLYGYADVTSLRPGQVPNYRHLGGVIVAGKGRPVRVKFSNNLPATHMLPFDPTIPMPGNGGFRQDRAAIHLHGGLVPWASDGGPFQWMTNPANPGGAVSGFSLVPWLPDSAGVDTDDYYYPNNQSARLMWYHDHAIGITRTNAYAGLASGYVITDSVEAGLGIPIGEPLIIQDKTFWDPAVDPGYANAVPGAQPGDLWYPYVYDTSIFDLEPGANPLPSVSAVPEFWADTMLVNGFVYPHHVVATGMYRFRILNACNARFMRLSFVCEDPLVPGEPLLNTTTLLPVPAPVSVWQIGTEGGFLPAPVQLVLNGTIVNPLVLGPAERADIIVDFARCPGNKVLLYNDAPAPFPDGASEFDYYLGAPNPVVTAPGFGPNTRTLMQFRVTAAKGPRFAVPSSIPVDVLPTESDPNGGLKLAASVTVAATRELTLNEGVDEYGRLMQLIGTNAPTGDGFGRAYLDLPTEQVEYGTVEIWNVYNLSADTHPMHFHLSNALVLQRRPIDAESFAGTPAFTGDGRGPEPNERGWKETVQMHPGECTRVALLFEDPLPGRTVTVQTAAGATYTGTLPHSPRLEAEYGIEADEYVWHCHILEHEEHDMMRPLVVTA